jgi:ankyrin repeat protein
VVADSVTHFFHRSGYTPFHYAKRCDNEDIMEFLRSLGANSDSEEEY